jgi:hypothetical protein
VTRYVAPLKRCSRTFRTVIPSFRCIHTWEFKDYGTFRGSSFEVFVRTVKSENFSFMPGESARDVF